MIEWLSIIFESNSDKARFITIIISALIAIFIFLLTQFFIDRRKRKELLLEKIEELYKCILEYENHAIALYKDIHKKTEISPDTINPYKYDYYPSELIDKMNNEVRNLQMIMDLYFSEIKFNMSSFYAGVTLPILEIRIKNKYITEDKSFELNKNSKVNIDNNVNKIKDICFNLMKRYSY